MVSHKIPFQNDNTSPGLQAQGHGIAITASDTTVYSPPLTKLYTGAGGNVTLLLAGDDTPVALASVPAASFIELSISKVMAATAATGLVGFW